MLLTGAQWKDPRSDTNHTHHNTLGAEGIGGAATDKNLKRSPCPAPRPALSGQLRRSARLRAGVCFDPALPLVRRLIFFEPNVIVIENEVFYSRPVAL